MNFVIVLGTKMRVNFINALVIGIFFAVLAYWSVVPPEFNADKRITLALFIGVFGAFLYIFYSMWVFGVAKYVAKQQQYTIDQQVLMRKGRQAFYIIIVSLILIAFFAGLLLWQRYSYWSAVVVLTSGGWAIYEVLKLPILDTLYRLKQ